MKDTNERIRLAMASIAHWLKIDPELKIVLCDGSNFDFTERVRKEFPGTEFECLPFANDQEKVRIIGRGYGEGEIVRYALNHSRLISEAGCFAKCTSKLWVENFKLCADEWNGRFLCKGVFLDVFSPFRKAIFSYIDTRFYIASVSFYRQYFEEAHKQIGMRYGKGFSLEDSFHEIVLEQGIKNILLTVSPTICGVGGGLGGYYKNTWIRRLKEDVRLKLLRMSSGYSKLFV